MWERMENLVKDPKRHRKVLTRTRIDEYGPGTILHDFNALIALLKHMSPAQCGEKSDM